MSAVTGSGSIPRRVAVLGGGAAGMCAAWELAARGVEVIVLERETRPGGLCGTHERDGFRFDFGGHRFISRDRVLVDRVRALLGSELLERSRSSVVIHRGVRYRYPLEPLDLVRKIDPILAARAALSYATEALRRRLRPAPDHSFEDWVVHRFGRTLYEVFFGPYTEKLWGIPASSISADWAAQRISLLNLGDVALRLAGLRRGGARSYARRYHYPRRGIGQIFERIADQLVADGGRILYGVRATAVELSQGRAIAVRHVDASGTEVRLEVDAVISTVSLPLLATWIDAGQDTAAIAGRLGFRGIRFLNLMLDRPDVSPHTWMYVSEPQLLPARIQEPRRRSPEAAPPGKTSLMLEIPCTPGDPVWNAPEDWVYARCMEDLERLGIAGLRADTLGYFSTFVEEGYPIYHLGYRADRAALLARVARVPNLLTCGRQGAFRYVFMDTAMAMGLGAARRLLGDAAARSLDPAELGAEQGLIEATALTA